MDKAADEQRWAAWMLAAQAGDQEAYARLLEEIAEAVRRYLQKQFAHAEFVDDCVQECLLAVHTARHSYQRGRPFRPWLFTIARHKAIDQLRRARRSAEPLDSLSAADSAALVAPDGTAAASEAGELLAQLSAEGRQALVLTKLEGYSVAEAAAKSGCSETAMKVRVFRAVRAARRLLARAETDRDGGAHD